MTNCGDKAASTAGVQVNKSKSWSCIFKSMNDGQLCVKAKSMVEQMMKILIRGKARAVEI